MIRACIPLLGSKSPVLAVASIVLHPATTAWYIFIHFVRPHIPFPFIVCSFLHNSWYIRVVVCWPFVSPWSLIGTYAPTLTLIWTPFKTSTYNSAFSQLSPPLVQPRPLPLFAHTLSDLLLVCDVRQCYPFLEVRYFHKFCGVIQFYSDWCLSSM